MNEIELVASGRPWPVALAEDVTGQKPFAVTCAGQALVLWRDVEGVVRALEDRCPHRRAPLSLGCVRENGWLQCGYHGWSFDGSDGRVVEIPNVNAENRFPPVYRAQSFEVSEARGLVFVGAKRTTCDTDLTYDRRGTAYVPLDQARVVEVLHDDPALLFAVPGVSFTDYMFADPEVVDGRIVSERGCRWSGLHWKDRYTSEFPLTLRLAVDPVTGETDVTLTDDRLVTVVRGVIALVPARRQVTIIHWRAEWGPRRPLAAGLRPPLKIEDRLNGAKIEALLVSASADLETLRLQALSAIGDTAAVA